MLQLSLLPPPSDTPASVSQLVLMECVLPNYARVKLLHAFATNLVEVWEWGEEEKLLLWRTGTMLRKGAPVQIPVTGTSFSTSFSIAGGNKITKIFVI